MTARPTHGPLPEGSPALLPAVEAVLDPARHHEVLTAHGSRLVVGGTDRLGRDVVLKVDRDGERHHREVDVLGRLRAAEVPVPEVLAAHRDDATDAWVLVLAHVDGRPLAPDDDVDAWAAVGEQVGRLHRALPRPGGPPFAGQTDGTFAQHLRAWGATEQRQGVDDGWLTSGQADRLGALVESATTGASSAAVDEVLLHGDCSPWHWLLTPMAEPRPIDLGDAGVGDPAYDLAVLTLVVPHRLGPVLDGYGADAALRDHLDAVLPGYRALRLAGEVSWLRTHGYDPSPAHARLLAALR